MVRLNHGWFAVKNRSTKEIKEGVTMEQRHINERIFFNTPPWTNLRRDRVGIGPLKSFLGEVLFDHIRNEFPGLVNEVQNLANETRKALEALGLSRQTSTDQRQYLIRSAVEYQRDVSNVLNGVYPPKLQKGSPRKLRTRVRSLIDEFASRMAKEGHRRAFKLVNGEDGPEYTGNECFGLDEKDDIEDWIRTSYHESRGMELPGTVNPRLLENLFREQSTNWENIAMDYLSRLIKAVFAYNGSALKEFVPDNDVRQKLQARLQDTRQHAEDEMFAELRKILSDELEGSLQTASPAYPETLAKLRQNRAQAQLASMDLNDRRSRPDPKKINDLIHNEQQAINDIHDILEAYYKLARERFVDNVIIQAGERYIVGEKGPLKIFSPEYVGGLSNEELCHVCHSNGHYSARGEVAEGAGDCETSRSLSVFGH